MKSLFIIFFIPLSCFAWTYLGPTRDTFPSSAVTINVSSNACPNAGLATTTAVIDAAMEAVNKYWNKVPTTTLVLNRGSVLAFDSNGATSLSTLLNNTNDNSILVGCNDDHASFAGTSGTLGIGTLSCTSNVSCRGALLLNDRAASNPIASGTRSQLLATMAHEIGHAIGLGHTSDAIALMYSAEDGRNQKYLTSDDIRGVSALYPQDKELGGLLGSCGTLAFVSKDNDSDGGSSGPFLMSLMLGGIFTLLILNIKKALKQFVRSAF